MEGIRRSNSSVQVLSRGHLKVTTNQVSIMGCHIITPYTEVGGGSKKKQIAQIPSALERDNTCVI